MKVTIKKVFVVLAILVLIGTASVFMYCQGMFLPSWVSFNGKEIDEGNIVLEDKSLTVILPDGNKYKTPDNLKVQDVIYDDVDGDLKKDIVIVCWKIGRYGNRRPFWVKKDEIKWSQHIFIYDVKDDKLKEKWCSSYTGMDIASISVDERHIFKIKTKEDREYHFLWRGFGLKNID